jgi:aldehyde:ferredoxin oxidoreductase
MRFLDVDLTAGTQTSFTVPEDDEALFLGGSGLGSRILTRETGPQTDPLGEDNVLIFSLGPLTGSGFPCSGRHSIVSRSPLTGLFAESDVGGRWGTELARTGWAGLIIRGRASRPTLLWVTAEGLELRDASPVWGLDTFEAAERLSRDFGPRVQAAVIGPAGERQVRLACVMHDGPHARAAGRCGLGAVMGSKLLKAVVVKGSRKPDLARPEEARTLFRDLNRRIKKASGALSTCGTAGGIVALEENGDLPIKNFRQSRWPGAEKLSGEALAELYLTGRFHCGACPIGCGREIEVPGDSNHKAVSGAGPEYESAGTLGSYCLVDDLEAVCRANDLCNRAGMDTISVGAAVAFAMEAFERGLLTGADLDGLELRWGDGAAMLEMVRRIAGQEGYGAVLGLGVRESARLLGPEALEFAMHVKGLELPAHDPRAFFSSGLSYATSNRGACHLAGMTHGLEDALTVPELGYPEPLDPFAVRGKGEMVAAMQNLMGLFDSLKVCKFVLGPLTIQDMIRGLGLVTGREVAFEDFLLTGERIFNLKRLYNLRCGVSRKDDTLPGRILTRPRTEGRARGRLPHLGRMLHDYYLSRGWDEFGRPRQETLQRLGLQEGQR